jgi:hypothetical protein
VPGYNQACSAGSWHLVDENTYKNKKGGYEKDTRNGISLTTLCSTHQEELRCWFLGTDLLEIKGRAFPRRMGSPSWSPSHAGWTNVAE